MVWLLNPNRIVSFSPRLPRFVGATLGARLEKGNNANDVVAEVIGARERNGRNRVAVGDVWGRLPRVALATREQPWANFRSAFGAFESVLIRGIRVKTLRR